MNTDLFNDFCRQGTEGKLELIDGKLIVGNIVDLICDRANYNRF